MRTLTKLLVSGFIAGFSFTAVASAQYPLYQPGYPSPYVHRHHHHHHSSQYSPYGSAYAPYGGQYQVQQIVPNYTSLYGANQGYIQSAPAVVPAPTVNNYYYNQPNRNHPWHLGHYLLGN